MLRLRYQTPSTWQDAVRDDLDAFLRDHAHAERKVASSAMALSAQHHRRPELVAAMIELAMEELTHFQHVHELLRARGQTIGQAGPDPYMTKLFKQLRRVDVNEYLLDRLLLFSIVEARGCERFQLVSEVIPAGPARDFYADLVRAEAQHHFLFLQFARKYFDAARVEKRLDELLDAEAEIVAGLVIRAALH